MTYVGYVHNAFYFIAVVFEHAAQYVHKNVRSQIADMCVVVYGRTARIHSNFIRKRAKFFFLSGQGVVNL